MTALELSLEELELISRALDSHWTMGKERSATVQMGNFIDDLIAEEECDQSDDEYDGQPDEAQEWYDFDPDC